MRIAAIQHDIAWEDGAATRHHLVPLITEAAASGAGLVVVSEMYATGFSMEPERVAEDAGGPNEQFLVQQAAEHGVWLIGSVAQWAEPADPEEKAVLGAEAEDQEDQEDQADLSAEPAQPRSRRRAANVAIVAGPAGQLHRYAKIHPFSYAGEHECYRAGEAFLTVPIGDLNVSVFICYDLRFADEFWALAAHTDLYVVVANWPSSRREHWRTLLRARAIENQAYVLGCNRVGSVDRLHHSGDSAIIDPLGRTLVEASEVESVLRADADPTEVKRVRDRFPFLADRR